MNATVNQAMCAVLHLLYSQKIKNVLDVMSVLFGNMLEILGREKMQKYYMNQVSWGDVRVLILLMHKKVTKFLNMKLLKELPLE